MKSKIFTLAAALLLSAVAFAQQTVSGVVTSAVDKQPLPGVVVTIGADNARYSITDLDGKYSIPKVADGENVVFTCMGFTTQTIPFHGQTINVVLKEDSVMLDETVVVGYGTMKKSDLAGASVSMKESDIRGSLITNLDQSLQGRAAGVAAVQTSGAPGSSSSIRVRGQGTINANAEPLYVIDGVIMQGNSNTGADFGLGDKLGNGKVSTISPLSTINPADIVSMEILKDASATAIYGAQGSNGVVLITTKRGKAGEAKFSYDGMVAVSNQSVRLDLLNLREFATFYMGMVDEGQIYQPAAEYTSPELLGKGTNWQDEIFRTAVQHSHQVSAQGGNDKVQYYVSGNYMNQQGTIIGSDFQRISARANLDAQLKSWLKLGLNLNFANTKDNLKLADGNEGLIYFSMTALPDVPVYDIDGNYSTVVREGLNTKNPIAMAMNNDIILKRNKFNGNIFLDVTPIKHLVWHTEFGFDLSNSDATTYNPKLDFGNYRQDNNEMRYQKNGNFFWQVKNYVTYSNTWGKHSMSAMIGQECWASKWDNLSGYGTNLTSDEVHNVGLTDPTTQKVGSGFGSSSMASFFARATYNYGDRYLATYTYRYDGSSNFGPDMRWAGFHSFALAWRFSNEKFFEPIRGWWNNGKLRFGWGQTGNSNIGGYAWGAAMSKLPSALGPGFRPANIPNTSIKWESQEQYNLGLDLGFFDSRLNLTLDLYYKTSKDMLMGMQLPSYAGTQGNAASQLAAPKGNYGSILNKGLEITLDAHPFNGKIFGWDTNLQFSFNRNKLLSLTGTENANLIGYGQWNDTVCVSEIGGSLYNFYGYEVEGVYKDLEDIQSSPRSDHYPADGVFDRSTTVWPGDLKFKDVDKNGKIDEKDRTSIGSPLPVCTFGWQNSFRIWDFDLGIFLNGSIGNKILNYNSITLTHMNSAWTNQLSSVLDRAQLEPVDASIAYSDGSKWYDHVENVRVKNPSARIPRASINDPNDNDRISSRYVEDGSYLRIKNISLGYNLPKKALKKMHFQALRVSVNIQNVYTFTKYSGYDPEVGASTQDSTGLTFGVDNGRYPSPRTYSFGLNFTF